MCAPPPFPLTLVPPGKGRGRGKRPAKPLNLSVKSLTNTKKAKPRPHSSSAGRELFDNMSLDTARNPQPQQQPDMNDIQENLNNCLNHSNHSTPSVAEDATVSQDMDCNQPVCSGSSVLTPDIRNIANMLKSLTTCPQ